MLLLFIIPFSSNRLTSFASLSTSADLLSQLRPLAYPLDSVQSKHS